MNQQIKTATGNPCALGVTETEDGYNFAVVSKQSGIILNLYREGEEIPLFVIDMDEKYKFGDIFAVRVSGDNIGELLYNYEVSGKTFIDPYGKLVCDTEKFGVSVRENGYRCRVFNQRFNWEDDRPINRPYSDTIIYKLHVRGFTKHGSSKVKHKGTYSGVTEKIPYLKELGITAVELMPVFEFEEVRKWTENDKNLMYNPRFNGKVNYWGYTGGMYFAPKAAYASDCMMGGCQAEFKQMVKMLHEAGIEVIVEMYFPYDAGINLIRDCVRYWVIEYHLDGVHLNCQDAALETIANDPLLSKTKLFTHYWNLNCNDRSYKNLANFNQGFMNTARKLLKGDENQVGDFVSRLKENSEAVANINYIADNNSFTLMDLVSYERKHNEPNGENNRDGEDFNNSWNCGVEGKCRKKKIIELRRRQMKNALIMVMLSQGTPLIMAGDEFGNSQLGNNNPYCQDNEISWLDWKNLDTNRDLFLFVKKLIAFRKEHPILHMSKPLRDMDYLSVGYPDISYHGDNAWFAGFENYNRHFGVMYCGKYAKKPDGGEDDFIYVAYNLHWEKHNLALPVLPDNMEWNIISDTAAGENLCSSICNERFVTVQERSVVVLIGKEKMV